MNLRPEIHQLTRTFHYEDLKHPFLRRGLDIPMWLSNYIHALMLRETLEREEIEQIRTEMKHIFTAAGVEIPHDFDQHFNLWFLLDFGDSEAEGEFREETPQTSPNGEAVERPESQTPTETHTENTADTPIAAPMPLTRENTIEDFQEFYGCSYEWARQLWHDAGGQAHRADTQEQLLRRIHPLQAQQIPDTTIATELGISRGKVQYLLKKHETA